MTKALQIALAVKALVEAALPAAEVRGFDGETSKPKRIGAGGSVIGHPLDHGEPDVDLSPPAYNYDGEVQLEISPGDGDGDLTLDEMIEAIGAGVRADRTLGGLCTYLSARAPDRNDRTVAGLATSNWAIVTILPEFTTDDPLA